MSDKPKVYQGVRVKTTVKELLQRERALRAALKTVKTISQGCLDIQDLCVSTLPGHYIDTAATTALQGADLRDGAFTLSNFYPRALFPADGACSIQMQESAFDNQQMMNMILPDESYNSSNSIASLPPPPSCELPWSQGHQSSNVDYYSHGMAPPSPSDSLNLSSPGDHNSYSPQDSFSSSSSSCYNSPSRVDSSYHGFAPEHYHYQHCNLQHCYCLSHCWPGEQESFPAQEYAPYYGPTDYAYATPVEENYFKRELPISSEMCYNVLL